MVKLVVALFALWVGVQQIEAHPPSNDAPDNLKMFLLIDKTNATKNLISAMNDLHAATLGEEVDLQRIEQAQRSLAEATQIHAKLLNSGTYDADTVAVILKIINHRIDQIKKLVVAKEGSAADIRKLIRQDVQLIELVLDHIRPTMKLAADVINAAIMFPIQKDEQKASTLNIGMAVELLDPIDSSFEQFHTNEVDFDILTNTVKVIRKMLNAAGSYEHDKESIRNIVNAYVSLLQAIRAHIIGDPRIILTSKIMKVASKMLKATGEFNNVLIVAANELVVLFVFSEDDNPIGYALDAVLSHPTSPSTSRSYSDKVLLNTCAKVLETMSEMTLDNPQHIQLIEALVQAVLNVLELEKKSSVAGIQIKVAQKFFQLAKLMYDDEENAFGNVAEIAKNFADLTSELQKLVKQHPDFDSHSINIEESVRTKMLAEFKTILSQPIETEKNAIQ